MSETDSEILPHNQEMLTRFRQELVVTGYSKQTIKTYLFLVSDFLKSLQKPVEETEKADIVGYIANRKEKENISNSSLALAHSALKFFFGNFLKLKIMEDVRAMKKAKKLPTVLTKAEVKALIKATKKGRNRLIVEFLYSSGVRVSEAVKLKVADLELSEFIGRVKGGKGNKDRIIILSKNWVSDLKRYLKRKKVSSEFVFSKKTTGTSISVDTIQRIIRKAAAKAGIQKEVTPHSMRHCVEANTRIFTSNGIVSAQALFSGKGTLVRSFEWNTQHVINAPLVGAFMQYAEGLLEVNAGGYLLTCTPEHRFFVATVYGLGEACAKDLKPGDFVLGPKKVTIAETRRASPAWWRFVGYALGDGTISDSRRGVVICDKNLSFLQFYQSLLEQQFGKRPFIHTTHGRNSFELAYYSVDLVHTCQLLDMDRRGPP